MWRFPASITFNLFWTDDTWNWDGHYWNVQGFEKKHFYKKIWSVNYSVRIKLLFLGDLENSPDYDDLYLICMMEHLFVLYASLLKHFTFYDLAYFIICWSKPCLIKVKMQIDLIICQNTLKHCHSHTSSFISGIKHEWQVNGLEDLKDRQALAEKLGGSSVISLEGAPI